MRECGEKPEAAGNAVKPPCRLNAYTKKKRKEKREERKKKS